METVTLKRGRGSVQLVKSDDLIAIRTTSQGDVAEALSAVAHNSVPVDTGSHLGGFQIVKVGDSKEVTEKTLNELRTHYLVDAGSHVYHTPSDAAPIVPTGKITLRFTESSTESQRQQVLDENHLEIVDSTAKQKPDGTRTETFTVRTTPEAPNPLKVAEKLQQQTDVVSLAEPDLATPGQLFAFQLPTDSLFKEQWHLKNDGLQFGTSLGLKAGADARVVAAWQRMQSTGSPACIVAVIDDGFDLSHPDLSGNSKVVAPWDFGSNTADPSPRRFNPDPRQGDYHGTACAGVAIGHRHLYGPTDFVDQELFLRLQEQLIQKRQENNVLREVNNVALPAAMTFPPASQAALESKKREASALLHHDDPQKGRWGGKSESNGLKVVVGEISQLKSDPAYYNVPVKVVSTDPKAHPLKGKVRFHLHDTFSPEVDEVIATNNSAKLNLVAYGAFTVGVETEDGTQLEVDLANEPGAPRKFRER
ncbi:MAG: pYEATS domain-containing protein [Pyrinomonadaceae bacterium]